MSEIETTEHWDTDQFGDPEDYLYVSGRTELQGWNIGEIVTLIEDGPEGGYEGDTGKIVGTSFTPGGLFGPGGDQLLILIEGQHEPVGVDPGIVEDAG